MRTTSIFAFLATAASLAMAQSDILTARAPSGRLSRCDPPASMAACRNDCDCDFGAAKPDCGHPVCSSHCWCAGGTPPPPYPPSPPPPAAGRKSSSKGSSSRGSSSRHRRDGEEALEAEA